MTTLSLFVLVDMCSRHQVLLATLITGTKFDNQGNLASKPHLDIIIVAILMHFLIFIIICIYEPISNGCGSIEVNILLERGLARLRLTSFKKSC